MRKFKHYIIWNIYLQRSCVCLAVLLRASHRSNSYFHYSSRFQQATVSTTCSSLVLLSSVQFTFMTPVFDGIACVNCVIYFKSRNVFNEWLRKLIVLCCLLLSGLEAGGWLMFVVAWKEFSNGTVQLVTGTLSLTIIFTSNMIIIVRYYVAGSTCWSSTIGVHAQYSATVLQCSYNSIYHTGILILQYCVQ